MRRRKPNTNVQVNLRIKEELRRELEAAAKQRGITFSHEVRARLILARRFDDLTNAFVQQMGSAA